MHLMKDDSQNMLCGSCQRGFSVAILTGDCIPDSRCGGDEWFWLLAALAAIAYTLWYTLHEDMVKFFLLVICLMLKCHMKKSDRNSQSMDPPSVNENVA